MLRSIIPNMSNPEMDVFQRLPYVTGPRDDKPFKPTEGKFTLSTQHWTLGSVYIPADLEENGPHYVWFDDNSRPYIPVVVTYEARFQLPKKLYTPKSQHVSNLVYIVR